MHDRYISRLLGRLVAFKMSRQAGNARELVAQFQFGGWQVQNPERALRCFFVRWITVNTGTHKWTHCKKYTSVEYLDICITRPSHKAQGASPKMGGDSKSQRTKVKQFLLDMIGWLYN